MTDLPQFVCGLLVGALAGCALTLVPIVLWIMSWFEAIAPIIRMTQPQMRENIDEMLKCADELKRLKENP